jgi:peptide methionine sulfoxide reductase MsrB
MMLRIITSTQADRLERIAYQLDRTANHLFSIDKQQRARACVNSIDLMFDTGEELS